MNKQILLLSLLAVGLLASCASKRNIVYLADMEAGVKYPVVANYESTVHCDENPELAIPFNIQSGNFQVEANGNVTSSETVGREKGYRVDVEGNIDFPILGKLHVESLKVSEVKNLIERRIKDGNYIKDPLVSVEFLNFRYTVLGAVAKNGTFTVNGDRVTLLEAIANAGDLTAKARMDRVTVIREVGDERQMFVHDLLESPCFYLQQNDIVYVEPRFRNKNKEDRGWQVVTVLLSLASVITSVFWVLK